MNEKPAPLRTRIDTLSSLPTAEAALYDYDGETWVLKDFGRHLAKLRSQMSSDPGFRLPHPKKAPEIALSDWTTMLSAATPAERKHLLGGVAGGIFKVKR